MAAETYPFLSEYQGGCRLALLIQPRASRSELVGMLDGRLKVRISCPPVEGKANKEVVRFFSRLLGVPKSSLEIVSGLQSRRKDLVVSGISLKDVLGRLNAIEL